MGNNAYEAGYHDGAINYELDHCPSCKNIADLQDALDENAKLRKLAKDIACEYECGYLTLPQWLADQMRELGVEVD